eukprot:Selendium_serpulae@DN1394_c0_g1_i1.p1
MSASPYTTDPRLSAQPKPKAVHLVLSGVSAGLLTKAAVSPLDRIRLLYQVQPMFASRHAASSPLMPNVKYRSIVHAGKVIVEEEGFSALWRGAGLNLIRASVYYGIKFAGNDMLKARRRQLSPSNAPLQLKDLVVAGGSAGFVQKTICFPIDLVAMRVALGANIGLLATQSYSSAWDCISRVYKLEGARGFYKGFGLTIATGVPYVAMQLTLFELFKRGLNLSPCASEGNAAESYGKVFLKSSIPGSLAGTLSQLVVFPGDTLRKRMMADGCDGQPRKYRHSLDCARTILRTEGARAFYSGLVPTLVRAVPSGAIQFGAYEMFKAICVKFDAP